MAHSEQRETSTGDDQAQTARVVSPVRTRLWPLLVVLAAAELAQIVFGFGTFVVVGIANEWTRAGRFPSDVRVIVNAVQSAMMEPAAVLVAAGMVMCAFTAIALFAAARSPVPVRDRLRLKRPTATPRLMLVALAGIVAIQLVAMALGALDLLPESSVLERAGNVISSVRGFWSFVVVLTVGMAPGIGEEFLFRGYVQTRLSERFGAWPAIVATALLFGGLHLDLVQGTFAFLMGLYLGLLVERTQSIWPAVLCHATNNSLAVMAQIGGYAPVSRERAVIVLVASLLVGAAATLEIWRFRFFCSR